jgi:hypothetical protein
MLLQRLEKVLLRIHAPWRGAQNRCPALFKAIVLGWRRQTGDAAMSHAPKAEPTRPK